MESSAFLLTLDNHGLVSQKAPTTATSYSEYAYLTLDLGFEGKPDRPPLRLCRRTLTPRDELCPTVVLGTSSALASSPLSSSSSRSSPGLPSSGSSTSSASMVITTGIGESLHTKKEVNGWRSSSVETNTISFNTEAVSTHPLEAMSLSLSSSKSSSSGSCSDCRVGPPTTATTPPAPPPPPPGPPPPPSSFDDDIGTLAETAGRLLGVDILAVLVGIMSIGFPCFARICSSNFLALGTATLS